MGVLIVDDMPDNVTLLEGILETKGYDRLFSATCAKEAFDILGVGGSEMKEPIDIVLMDIMMPDIDGIEGCRVIKAVKHLKDVPVIMVTAKVGEAFKDAFDAGAMDYITKPVNSVELLVRLKSALSLKRALDQRKAREKELEERNQELEVAMSEIQTLRGFIPICAYCKKIRDIQGMWQQMEEYIQERSQAKFSHGICEDCMKEELKNN